MRTDLEAGSFAIGDAWVARVQRDLRNDNRVIAGGWPGTMREARAATHAHFTNADARRQYGVLTSAELELAARITYEHARKRWLSSATTENEGDS